MEQLIEQEGISQGILRLDPEEREIILLYYYQELRMKEIASIIGTSENAAGQRLSRARRNCEEFWKEKRKRWKMAGQWKTDRIMENSRTMERSEVKAELGRRA